MNGLDLVAGSTFDHGGVFTPVAPLLAFRATESLSSVAC